MAVADDPLGDHHDGWELPADLYEVRGVYHPMQFAVRLHAIGTLAVHGEVRGIVVPVVSFTLAAVILLMRWRQRITFMGAYLAPRQ